MVQIIKDPAAGHSSTSTTTMDANSSSSSSTTTETTSHHLWSSPSSSSSSSSPANHKQRSRRGYSVVDLPREINFHHAYNHQHIPSAAIHTASSGQISTHAAIPENAVLNTTTTTTNTTLPLRLTGSSAAGAAKTKKPPRRSYSATDKEPEEVLPSVGLPQPSAHLGILDMPPELHYTLFDYLDPIDAVCLGLAHSQLYSMHRRKHAHQKIPLSSRYNGPNDREWAWRGTSPASTPTHELATNPLDKLRVKGQVYCRKCGVARCELHRHLRSWMGDGYEYCEIKKQFGQPAGGDAKAYCFMSSPKDRHRCGRHGGAGVKGASSEGVAAA